MKTIRQSFAVLALAVSATVLLPPKPAHAQTELSVLSAMSALPIASVIGATVAIPVALSTAGAVLVIKTVQVTARGTVYLLERASDGAAASIEILGASAAGASVAVGAVVTVTAISTGVILSTASQAIAFIPNEIGRALFYNERVWR
jgi:hypothetical protein